MDIYDRLEEKWSNALNLPSDMVWTAKEVGLELSKRSMDNWDNLIGISGEKGSSKTTLAQQIGIWQQGGPGNLSWMDYAKSFLTNNVIYSCPARRLVPRIIDRFSYLPKYSSIVVDEIKDLHKRQFQSALNIEMAKFVGKNRKWVNPETGEDAGNKTLIMCLDNIMSLDKEVRNVSNIHIHIITRGLGVLFRPARFAYIHDPFFSDLFQKLFERTLRDDKLRMSQLLSITEQIKLYEKMPTYDGVVVYPNLDLEENPIQGQPGPVEQFYIQMDAKSKSEKGDKDDDDPKLDKFKKMVLQQVRKIIAGGKTQEEALAELGEPVTSRTYRRWEREAERQQKLNI
jgi:hypothetical protein